MNAAIARDLLMEKGYVIPKLNTTSLPLVSSLLTAIETQPYAVEQLLRQLDDVEEVTASSRTYPLEVVGRLLMGFASLVYDGELLTSAQATVVNIDSLEPLAVQEVALQISE